MAQIPVSVGIPALVARKRSHVVNLVDARRLELVRLIPYAVLVAALAVVDLAYAGFGPLAALGNPRGIAIVAEAAALILAFTLLFLGPRVRVDRDELAQAGVVFLHEWTGALLLCLLAVATTT